MLIVIIVNPITIVTGMIAVWTTDVFQNMSAKIVANQMKIALIAIAA